MESSRTIEDCHRPTRAVAALANGYPDGYSVVSLRSSCAQLIHALNGAVTVVSERGSCWVVPAGRAVWIPAGSDHAVRFFGDVSMRTVFVAPGARPCLPDKYEVIEVSPLLREAIVAAMHVPLDYELGGRDHRIMELILDELQEAPRLQLHVGMPRDPQLMCLCDQLIANPSGPVTLASLAAGSNVSMRTLARRFDRELGMSFGQWLRRMRLLLSLPRLAAGVPVSQVALEYGYTSSSAYTAMFRRTFGIVPTAYLNGVCSSKR